MRHSLVSVSIAAAAAGLAGCSALPNMAERGVSIAGGSTRPAETAADAQYRQGKEFLRLGRSDLAAGAFEAAVRLDPRHADALSGLGAARLERGNIDGAVQAFTDAVALQPDAAHLQNNLGYALMRAERHRDAARALAAALKLEPGNALAQANWAALKLSLNVLPRPQRIESATLATVVPVHTPHLNSAAGNAGTATVALGAVAGHGGIPIDARNAPSALAAPALAAPAITESAVASGSVLNLQYSSGNGPVQALAPATLPARPVMAVPGERAAATTLSQVLTASVIDLSRPDAPPRSPNEPRTASVSPQALPPRTAPAATGPQQLNGAVVSGNTLPAVTPPRAQAPATAAPTSTAPTSVVPTSAAPASAAPASMTPTSVAPASIVLTPTATAPRAATRIEIVNGNGIAGAARDTGRALRSDTISVVRVGNGGRFDVSRTVIHCRTGFMKQALALSRTLPGRPAVLANDTLHKDVDVRIVLGRDHTRVPRVAQLGATQPALGT